MKQNGELIFTGGMQYHYSDKYFLIPVFGYMACAWAGLPDME